MIADSPLIVVSHKRFTLPSTRILLDSFLYFLSIVAISPRVILPHLGSEIGVFKKSKLSLFFHSIRKSYFFSQREKFPIGWSRLYDHTIFDIFARVSQRLSSVSCGMTIFTSYAASFAPFAHTGPPFPPAESTTLFIPEIFSTDF